MVKREVHLEMLLGKRVKDAQGRVVGLIEEVRAEERGGEWVVKEYHIGPHALLERLSAETVGEKVLGLLRVELEKSYRVQWDELDLADPEHPRLRCEVGELEKLSGEDQDEA